MSRLSRAMAAPWRAWRSRRAADLAQARRIAAASVDGNAAWRGLPWAGDVVHQDMCYTPGPSRPGPRYEAEQRIGRTSAVLARTQANASPRAARWGALLSTWGSLNPPPTRRLQSEILGARKAARDYRGDVMDGVRDGRMAPAEGDALLSNWRPYTHPRDPLARGSQRGRSR